MGRYHPRANKMTPPNAKKLEADSTREEGGSRETKKLGTERRKGKHLPRRPKRRRKNKNLVENAGIDPAAS